jgi:hypothetical protein
MVTACHGKHLLAAKQQEITHMSFGIRNAGLRT